MALKLRVISDHYKQLGKQSSRLFGVTGGRIGRSADNDWVLPDPERYISSHHAKISFQAGKWIFEDTSTNGVYLNGADAPVSQQGPVQLHDGDRLRMGDYELLVSIDERVDFPPDASGQMPAPAVARSKPAGRQHDDELDVAIDIHELLSSTSTSNRALPSGSYEVGNAFGIGIRQPELRTVAAAASHEVFEDIPLHDDHVAKTTKAEPGGDDWHLRTRRFDKPTLVRTSSPADRPRNTESSAEVPSAIEAFCRGAGIDPSLLPSDAYNTALSLAGQIMRESVLGLMESLKARGEAVKGRDVNMGGIQGSDNNPLKISSSVDDAIRKLLDMHNMRYMGPVESIRDAFSDLRIHQQSVISAMHSGINGMLEKMGPAELQEKFDRSLKRGALMGATNKMKYWDMYSEFFQVINQRNADGLPLSFAEDFSQAYAERTAGFKTPKRK